MSVKRLACETAKRRPGQGRRILSSKLLLLGLAVASAPVAACSLAFDLDRKQCTEDSDCASGICEGEVCLAPLNEGGGGGVPIVLPDNLACVEGFVPPELPEMIHHHYRFEIATAPAGTPPTNLVANLCAQLDADCLDPIGDPMIPEADGTLEFDVPKGFTGRLEVTADDTMPAMVFFQPPSKIPEGEKLIRTISENSLKAIAASQGVTLDTVNKGIIVAFAFDCSDEARVVGGHFSTEFVDPAGEMLAYHFRNDLPDQLATVTDGLGAGGWVNVPKGPFTCAVEWCETSPTECPEGVARRTIGTASFLVKDAMMSYVPMGPTAP